MNWHVSSFAFVGLCGMLAGCTQFPSLDPTQTKDLADKTYPKLVPLEPLLAQAAVAGPDPIETQEGLTARLERLRGRADAIRGAVLSGPEKARLEQGLR